MLSDGERIRILNEAREDLVALLPQAIVAIQAALEGTCQTSPQKLAAAMTVLNGLGTIGAGGEDFGAIEDLAALDDAAEDDEGYPAAEETIPEGVP